MDISLEENPANLILPIEITKIIYADYDAELSILDKPGQVRQPIYQSMTIIIPPPRFTAKLFTEMAA